MPAENELVHNELEALIEKVQFGSMDCTLELHNKKITGLTVFGKKCNRYTKDNFRAVKDIAERIKTSCDRKDNTKLYFSVEMKKGDIFEILWTSKIQKKYIDE